VARSLLIIALLITASAGDANAGEVACHFEGGVITAPAELAGIPGDYIIDTGAAQTTLHETRAQAEGITDTALTGDVQLGGVRTAALPLAVADLDLRTWNLPTPVAGVIGSDALRGYVVDVSFAPCRLRLTAPGGAPRFRGKSLSLGWDLGRPTAPAAVSDDVRELRGSFVIATGANAPVRLADDLVMVDGAAKPDELYPQGVWLARLPQARFGRAVGRDVAAGLMKPDGEVAGVLGGEVLAHFRLRFDFPANRLVVAPVGK
jgi:hypothetical protein